MSKQSRRPGRRSRPGRQRNSFLSTGELRMSVVTAPGSLEVEGHFLRSDLELVRSSVLYADSIDLISVGATVMRAVEDLRSGGLPATLRLMGALDDSSVRRITSSPLPDDWRRYIPLMTDLDGLAEALAASGLPVTEQQLADLKDMADVMVHAVAPIEDIAQGFLNQSGMDELWPAVRSGLVKLEGVGTGGRGNIRAEDLAWVFLPGSDGASEMMEKWQTKMTELLSDPQERLLLDEQISGVVREMTAQDASIIPRQTHRLASEAAVGTGLIARLPAFPNVPMDELLSLRSDLDEPLSRYRMASQKLAGLLNAVSFSLDWRSEIDELWRNEVKPSVVAVEDELTEHALVREIAKSAREDARFIITGGSALVATIGTTVGLQTALQTAVATAFGSGITAAWKGIGSARAARQKVGRDDLYYLVYINRNLNR